MVVKNKMDINDIKLKEEKDVNLKNPSNENNIEVKNKIPININQTNNTEIKNFKKIIDKK